MFKGDTSEIHMIYNIKIEEDNINIFGYEFV